ncbi:glycosyltransferase [Candidatus Peregrinibacteria bacterium]|nr:MAG: glycosyltransferase [Candidatus Peregrinibacteria bacterium]
MNKHLKIAIIADWMTNYGGAESVISAFHDCFPDAPIYTTLYKPKAMRELGKLKNVKTSILQKIPLVKHQWMLGQMTTAVELFDLDEFDIVLSSCHSISKGVITNPETLHISYCHTPMRYAWESWDLETRIKKFPKITHQYIRKQIDAIRKWDFSASQRVDRYIANSDYIAKKIEEHYHRKADVIYPPVHAERFKPAANPTEDYYLAVGRLIPYKKFDLIAETFNKNGKKVKIVGTGPDLKKIQKMAGPSVEVLGAIENEALAGLYANCKALIFPQIEDAGIVPLEAMAAGRPVIALSQGGSLTSMKEGVTGIFFEKQTVQSLNNAINRFESMQFNPKEIRKHAEQFDITIFKQKIKGYVEKEWNEFQKNKSKLVILLLGDQVK